MRFWIIAMVLLTGSIATAAEPRPMKVTDLFSFKRVGEPQLSPDGTKVVYQVTTVSLEENKSFTNLYLVDMNEKAIPLQLTTTTKKDSHPRWSPDGKKILFESTRSGSPQLWVLDLAVGGEAKQLTNISTGAANGIWSPDGKQVAFVSSVHPEFSELAFEEADKKNAEKDAAAEKSPVKAKVFTKLFYRHWAEYTEDKRGHLFVIGADGKGCRNVTPGDRDAYPNSSTFSVGDDFTFTPDSKSLVFAASPVENEAWSTDYNLCRVSIDNKSTKWETLTGDNKAADNSPRFSLDGKKIAWRAQKKAGYEADKWDILVADCDETGTIKGKITNATESIDVSVNEFIWYMDGFVFTADQNGSTPIFRVAQQKEGWKSVPIFQPKEGANSSLSTSMRASPDNPKGGSAPLVFSNAKMNHPAEVFTSEVNLSKANADLLKELSLARPESLSVDVEGKVKMQMWLLKPPGFDPKKKWPVVYLVHGGPQSAWEDAWSFRWNPQAWAARGYVVVMPNPRGSTGFGQKFCDEITGDWGGKCYRDLVAGLDAVEKLPYVDKDRIASAGASFGGYMMNWFAVNDISKRFKTLITHCSVWNFDSMWGTTDELWFDEYEHGGLPWEKPEKYREFSPHAKAGKLKEFKTPMLIIHNDLDFRCPIGQGHELFTALQRQKVPSRFVNFPDEGHWVLKPKNSEKWHNEVFTWLEKYVTPGGK